MKRIGTAVKVSLVALAGFCITDFVLINYTRRRPATIDPHFDEGRKFARPVAAQVWSPRS